MDLYNDLKSIIKGEVSNDSLDLKRCSTDASIFEIEPKLVVSPQDTDDVCKLVNYVSSYKTIDPSLSLTARSGGTDMSGGSLGESIIVDFNKHLTRVDAVVGNTITTQPGAFYRDFEKVTLAAGLLMPSYPASRSICTIGGMVNNNSGGEKSLLYGQTKEYIEELHVVLQDGNEYTFSEISKEELDKKTQQTNFEGQVYKEVFELVESHYDLIKKSKPTTSKNSSGYFLWDVWDRTTGRFNMCKLVSGAQGTLGFVTQAKFRLIKPAPVSQMLVIFLNDMTQLGTLVHDVVQQKPETFESYDKHTFSLAMKLLPSIIQKMKGSLLSLAWQFLPEIWMSLTGGIPNLVLIAEFTGNTTEEAMGKALIAEKVIAEKYQVKTHITKTAQETEKYWIMRRESFNLLRQHVKNLHTAPFIDDIIVHPEQLPEFLPKLNAIFDEYPHLIYTLAGHAGDANFHIIPLMDLSKQSDRDIIVKMSHEVYDLVQQFNGSITAEHNDGLIRTPFLHKMYSPEMLELFSKVKAIFDPKNIFNPNKKVGGTEEYALLHMKKH